MDTTRFDKLTRSLSRGVSRRGALALLGGAVAVAAQRGASAQLGLQCGSLGKPCTMLAGCCDGLTCVTSAINTNYGVCLSGGSGGTVSSGTQLVLPFESAQGSSSTGVDSSTTSTGTTAPTTTTGTTTSTVDAKAARRSKRQSRRTTRRSKSKSRRTTQETKRKQRREDAVLAAGPELQFSILYPNTGKTPYEVLQIANPTDYSVYVSSVELKQNSRVSNWVRKTIASGGRFGLVSGLPNGTAVSSDEFLWMNDVYVCPGDTDNSANGWVVKAAFSTEVENRTYTILCDGSVNGVPITADEPVNNKRRKKRKQQQQRARKKRADRKHRNNG
ncbi:MAG: hypothetical protein QM692_16790 [Thermomicrobiales bacterium]